MALFRLGNLNRRIGECMIANALSESRSVMISRPGFTNAFLSSGRIMPTPQQASIGSGPAAVEAAGMSRQAKGKSPKPKRPKTKLGLPDLYHSKACGYLFVITYKSFRELPTARKYLKARGACVTLG